ncbi:hypothetical protein X943_003665 [Babesia divergens]|uniref:Ribosomal RNA-processing protein 8 n=1 Tax=Babesia divergens TaxID=32595 RepID=A0AAD9LLU8_BABDI|nr:hypothetical protein X943_003665 [Babesia divergens]
MIYSYKQQVSQWPFNPLTRVITWLKGMDKGNVIGDFGCGEAQIAQAFPDRMVYSFDLVAGNPLITACNIAKVLMGSDWPMFLLEGTRCLKQGGILKIVEVKSRFSDINGFDRFIESLGYKKQCDTTPNVGWWKSEYILCRNQTSLFIANLN